MPIDTATLRRYRRRIFVETGTGNGHAIRYALEAGFERAVSIEFTDEIYERAARKFADDPRVTILHGDSGELLWPAIKDIREGVTFWLDAHGKDGGDLSNKPLLRELAAIARHHIKHHIILIDDWDYVVKANRASHLTEASVRAALANINPAYRLSRIDGQIIERRDPYWLVMVAEV